MGGALSKRTGKGTLPGEPAPDDRRPAEDDVEPERRLADIERYARLMEVFISVLSHDLRNPLTAILTAAEMLRPDQDVVRPAQRIRSAADRMGRMIDQLLDYSRIKMGAGLPLDCREIDLAPVGRMVVGELEVAYPERSIRFEHSGSLWGGWDRDRMAQLLSNLGGNACQHGDDPIVLRMDGGDPIFVRIAVENRGTISDELIPDLFEPGIREGRTGGLGLGLYIAQQIAAAHGGSIQVTSSATTTRFLVEIPRAPQLEDDTGTFKLEPMPRTG